MASHMSSSLTLNHRHLGSLLIGEDKETIYSIIGRMQTVLDIFRAHEKYKGLVPFLQVYYFVTRHVAYRGLSKRYFHQYPSLETLDVAFAKLYFDPLKAFLFTDQMAEPWRTYYTYCSRNDGLPFVQMILGINTHINTDLAQALATVRYHDKHDFLAVNSILASTIGEILRYLFVHNHDLYAAGGLAMPLLYRQAFKHSILSWRADAWDNAHVLRRAPGRYSELNQKTEELGENLIELFGEMSHGKHLYKDIERLYNLRVQLHH